MKPNGYEKGDDLMVGERIKAYLEENGITQTHLSNKTGIERVRMHLLLKGERRMEVTEYFSICDALNLPYDTFAR